MSRYIDMGLVHWFQPEPHDDTKRSLYTHLVIIRRPHSFCILKVMARAVILLTVIVSLPWLGSVIGGLISNFHGGLNPGSDFVFDPLNVELLPILFHDLANEDLLKMGDRALYVSNDAQDEAIYSSQSIKSEMDLDLISYTDVERQRLIPDETFDYTFTGGFTEFVDRALKVGGVAIVQLSNNPMVAFHKPANYKIVYLRRFDATVVDMRKMSNAIDDHSNRSATQRRRLCGLSSPEVKKAALKNLEDVLLEPPRAASGKSNRCLKKTRYLPDLTGDSLESYPRRVFIDVCLPEKNIDAAGASGWFAKHYLTRNKKFEIHILKRRQRNLRAGRLRKSGCQIG